MRLRRLLRRPARAEVRFLIAERFVSPVSRLAAVRLPLDVVARQAAERLCVLLTPEEPRLGERVAILRPRDPRPDEHWRLEFEPFDAPAGATFLIGVAALPAAAATSAATELPSAAALRTAARGRPPIQLDCHGADADSADRADGADGNWSEGSGRGAAGRDPARLPDESAMRVFREGRPAGSGVRVAHWIDQFWCDAHGIFLSGWVHAFEHPVRKLAMEAGGRGVETESFRDRPDLLIHYPQHEHVRHAGFSLYLAVGAGHPVRLRVETDGGAADFPLQLPEGPLPPLPAAAGGGGLVGASPLMLRFADLVNAGGAAGAGGAGGAGGGRILQIGARTAADADAPLPLARRLLGGKVFGFDIHPGPRVDVVGDAHGLSRMLRAGSLDAVLSGAVLEHVAAPWLVAAEINRILKPGGLTYHTVPAAWPPHAQPNDFWRFSADALRLLFGPDTGFEVLDATDAGPATLLPGPGWRRDFLDMPTLPVYTCAEILARKVADLAPGAVAWPLDAGASQRRARLYPIAGVAAARDTELER